MDKWSLNDREIETINAASDDLLRDMRLPVEERKGFRFDEKTVVVPRYFYRFIGADFSGANALGEYIGAVRGLGKLGLATEGFSTRAPEPAFEREFQMAWARIRLLSDVQPKIVAAALKSRKLFPEFPNKALERQIADNFEGLLEYYFEALGGEIEEAAFESLLRRLLWWIRTQAMDMLMEYDYAGVNPKILYYGDIGQEEIWFLIYLSSLGFDILFFNPQSERDFSLADPSGVFSREVVSWRREPLNPHALKGAETATRAQKASEMVEDMLQDEAFALFRSWQCADCEADSALLATTHREIFILWKEQAALRPGWSFHKGKVRIPNIFAKIEGVEAKPGAHQSAVQALIDAPNAVFVNRFPFSSPFGESSWFREVAHETKSGWRIDEGRMKLAPWWPYKPLRQGLQNLLASKIASLVANPAVLDPRNKDAAMLAEKTLLALLALEEKFQSALQAFDYPKEVPKIVLHNDGKSGEMSFADCAALALLSACGCDIALFNPGGYRDIEAHIHESLYARHRLEKLDPQAGFEAKKDKKWSLFHFMGGLL